MRRVLILLVLGALAVAAAGCGGGNKSASATTSSSTTTTTISTSTTTTAESATTENTATTPVFASGKCKDLVESAQKIGKDLSAASASGNLQDVAKEFQAFANTVPSEIKGDVQVLAAALTKYASVLKSVHFKPGQTPSTADLVQLQSALKSIDQPKLRAAQKHLAAWAQKNC